MGNGYYSFHEFFDGTPKWITMMDGTHYLWLGQTTTWESRENEVLKIHLKVGSQ